MKNTSKDAYLERLRNLAEVNKTSLKESKNRTLGSLIDYKRATDGVAYGIIKESHNYYIKRGGIKSDPDVSDFAYIGGLSNITNYQYKSLSEADKNRNMLLRTINESSELKFNKKRIYEDKAGEEIDYATDKLDDLDAATANNNTPDDEMAAGLEAEPNVGNEMPTETGNEMPAETGNEMPAETGDEMPTETGDEIPAETDDEMPAETDADQLSAEDDPTKEIEKGIGKITNLIRKTELEPSQVQSFVNSYLAAFKDKFPDIEIEDRKEMANKILKVVPPEDVATLSSNMPPDEMKDEGLEEAQCSECGSFAMYAESMGYNSAQSLMECGEEEVTNLISGYANANTEGKNDGDHENVALVIKIINPNILDNLKNDYGHDEYVDKLTPNVKQMNEETEEESIQKLDELFGGLGNFVKGAFNKVGGDAKNVATKAGQAIGNTATKAGQAIGGAATKAGQAIGGAASKAGQAVGQYADDVKKAGYKGQQQAAAKELSALAQEFKRKVDVMNNKATMAGGQPIDLDSILQILTQQLTATVPSNIANNPSAQQAWSIGKARNLGGLAMKEDNDPAMTNVQPDLGGTKFAPPAQTLGVVKSDNTSDSLTEGEIKLRKYIRNRLEEHVGLRKSNLNENAKSARVKKLDEAIDKKFEEFRKIAKRKLK